MKGQLPLNDAGVLQLDDALQNRSTRSGLGHAFDVVDAAQASDDEAKPLGSLRILSGSHGVA